MPRVATEQCTRNLEVGHSVRKDKVKNMLKESGKATMVSRYSIVEEDAMKFDNEVSDEENKYVTMHKAEKMTAGGMRDGTERNLKRRKRNNVKDDALSSCENKRERKKRKIEKDNVVVTQSKEKKLQGSDAEDKIKLVACNREVKDDGDEKALMDDIEEIEKERKAEKKKRKKEKREQKMLLNGEEIEKERKAEKKKRKKDKREQKMLLNGEEMEKERKAEKKKRKKDKRDCMVISVDKETKAKKKKKKIEKDNVVVTQSKEKKRKRKDIKGDVVAGHEEHNKLKDENENKKKEVIKRKKNKVLFGLESKKEIKKKKEKRDCTMLLGDEETEVQKKKSTKKKERDDVEVAGIEEKRVERKTKNMRDDMKTHNREKRRGQKDIEFEDDVVADLEEQNKLQHENQKTLYPSESLKSLIDNAGGMIQGKRYSKEENELVKKAVLEYIEVKKLGKEGLDMVLECKSKSLVRGCWQEIARALPWRPYRSVYQRARRLFMRGDSNWTAEDVQHIRNSYEKYGPKWKKMADELGKYHCHVRNAFQRYQFGNLNRGKWSQQEYQTLFELVNKDLQINVLLEKKSCHGMLRDNIKWETISWKIGTRHNASCCAKWYKQLTSPMVAQGIWVDADDYKLLMVLDELDASCEEEVEWDNLLEYRSGEVCRKRWLQMAHHLGEHGNKTFSEQVEVLSKRYCPDLAELREDLDARPIVD